MIDNKYKRWYFSLVEKVQYRILKEEILKERHHIIPISLGGNNEKSNIVYLTIREHLLVHRLLPKFLDGIQKSKMCHAYFRMVRGRQGKFINISDSAQKILMIEYSEARKIMRNGTKHSEETKKKISLAHIGKINSKEARQKISIANTGKLLGLKRPKEFGENLSRIFTGLKKTKEHSDKINKNPEKIRKTAEKHLGMKRSAEAKKNMSIAQKKRCALNGPWNKGSKRINGRYIHPTDLKTSTE
jgi:hypothetical protein